MGALDGPQFLSPHPGPPLGRGRILRRRRAMPAIEFANPPKRAPGGSCFPLPEGEASDGVEEVQQLPALNREEEEIAVTRISGLAVVGADSCVHRRGAAVVKIRGTGAQTPQRGGPHFTR